MELKRQWDEGERVGAFPVSVLLHWSVTGPRVTEPRLWLWFSPCLVVGILGRSLSHSVPQFPQMFYEEVGPGCGYYCCEANYPHSLVV